MPKLRTNSSSSLSSSSSGGGGGINGSNSSGLSCGSNSFCFVVDSNSELQSPSVVVANNDSLKFEQKRRLSSSTTSSSSLSSLKNKEQRSMISSSGELSEQQEIQNMAAERTLKMKSDLSSFSSKKIFSSTSSSTSSSSSQSNISYTISSLSSSTKSSSQLNGLKKIKGDDEAQMVQQSQLFQTQSTQPQTPSQNSTIFGRDLSDLQDLNRKTTSTQEIKNTMQKYVNELDACIRAISSSEEKTVASSTLQYMDEMLEKAWAVPAYGYDFGSKLCDTVRTSGGLDMLISNCADHNGDLQMISAKMLSQCLTAENCDYVVTHGLDKVVNAACGFTKSSEGPVTCRRVATEILENLFKHSEEACSNVIKLGGLDSVLYECRKKDVETLRNCAGALANLSLYGGGENHVAMIEREVPNWLFPLAFHTDDNVKYYACLAITALAADSEIEGAVLRSGTLDLVEPFVTRNRPLDFARTSAENARGKSTGWLRRLVPVLASSRAEARNLAAFHFCMEAGIKKNQCRIDVFHEIGAVPALRAVASCPNATASRLAAQALRIIGEPVPHTLSQQVPVWTIDDVREWVTQIGFSEYANSFVESSVDGDLLLQLSEDDLKNDIGLTNGIKRRRFTRELKNLKKIADYTCKDYTNMNSLLQHIHIDFSMYTYNMLNAGVDCSLLPNLREDQLEKECGIANSIHRLKILEFVNSLDSFHQVGGLGCNGNTNNGTDVTSSATDNKNIDVFVSYRRSNGSQLASLLKVHLQIRGFSVFLDVERLEAGKFDNNLLKNVRQAKNFLLVLTPQALERCVNDQDGKDWVHREIVAALQSQCNIIPIIDNFQWPEPEQLPEDMRSVCHFNGVKWIHDYQDACVDKVERFMRGELNSRIEMMLNKTTKNGELTPTLSTPTIANITTPLFTTSSTASSIAPSTTPAAAVNRQNGLVSFAAAAAANNKLFFDNETFTNGFLSKAIVN